MGETFVIHPLKLLTVDKDLSGIWLTNDRQKAKDYKSEINIQTQQNLLKNSYYFGLYSVFLLI